MAYNPFWNQYDTREFCDDLIPCEDDTHNVGSSTQRWKKGYFSDIVQGKGFLAVSDKRLKKNITTLDNPLDTIREIRGVTYDWKNSGKAASGVVAQEVFKVAPECISKGEDGMMRVDYNALVGYCIEGIRSLDRKINGGNHGTGETENSGTNDQCQTENFKQ